MFLLHHCFYYAILKNFLVSPYGVDYKNPSRSQNTHSKMEKICEICGKTFTRARDLKRHVATFHQNVEVQCAKCGKTFTRVDSLKRHVEAVHRNDEVQCKKCFKIFNRKDIMERHQQKCCVCRLCGVDFSNSLELARHHCAEKNGSKAKPHKKRTDSR